MSDNQEYESQEHWEVLENYKDVVSNTEEALWDNAVSYFKWCKDNPIETKWTARSGKDIGKKFLVESPRMLTVKGLCLHCNVLEEYLRDIWTSKNTGSLYYIVVTRILYIIHTQNMEYAALDIFNSVLVSKLHNIEREEVPTGSITVNILGNLPSLATSEIEVLEKLDEEMKLFPKEEL